MNASLTWSMRGGGQGLPFMVVDDRQQHKAMRENHFEHVLFDTVTDCAQRLVDSLQDISARDAAHAAAFFALDLEGVSTFDRIAGCKRIAP